MGPPVRNAHVRCKQVFRDAEFGEFTSLDPARKLPSNHLARRIKVGLSRIDLTSLRNSYGDKGGIPYDPLPMVGILLLGYGLGITSSRDLEDHCRYDLRFIHICGGHCPDYRTIARFRKRLEVHLKDLWKAVHRAAGKRKRRIGIDGTKMASAGAPVKVPKNEIEQLGYELLSSDPEASFHKGRTGLVFGYNAQAVVDLDTHEVLYTDVVHDKCDRNQLLPMVNGYIEVTGELPEAVVADTGYDEGGALLACEDMGIEVTVPSQSSYDFWSVVDDQVLCPMGHAASVRQTIQQNGRISIAHSVPESCCRGCTFRAECLGKSRRKTIRAPEGVSIAQRVLGARRARAPDAKQAMIDRKSHVEPFFGRIKWNKKCRRFNLRGLAGARIELALFGLCETIASLGKAIFAAIWVQLRSKTPKRRRFFALANIIAISWRFAAPTMR